jgi:hypothetical protein
MVLKSSLLVLVLLAAAIQASEEVHGSIDIAMYRKYEASGDIKILLNGGIYSTFVRQDGRFVLFGVEKGTYFMEIVDPNFYYKPLVIEVTDRGVDVYDGVPGQVRGKKTDHPISLKPDRPIAWFDKREPFSVMKLLYNPMVLMTGVTLLIVFLAPKMQLDPEQMKEMREM